MPITVDKNLCIGCGACVAVCPDCFKLNDEGKSEAICDNGQDCAQNAAQSCPVQAIKVS